MAKLDLKSLLEKQLEAVENKDVILQALKLEEIQKAIDNDYVNPIVKKTKEELITKVQSEVQTETINNLIKELNIEAVENVDGLKAYAKRLQGSTQEKDEVITRLEKELNALKPQYEQLNKDLQKRQVVDKILESGFNRKYVDDVYTIAQNKVSEEKPLETVLAEMKVDYKMFVAQPVDSGSYHADGNSKAEPVTDDLEKWRKEAGLKKK